MKLIGILIVSSFLCGGCSMLWRETSRLDALASLSAGMEQSEVREMMGRPAKRKSTTLENGKIQDDWRYRILYEEESDYMVTHYEYVPYYDPFLDRDVEVLEPIETLLSKSTYLIVDIEFIDGKLRKWTKEIVEGDVSNLGIEQIRE